MITLKSLLSAPLDSPQPPDLFYRIHYTYSYIKNTMLLYFYINDCMFDVIDNEIFKSVLEEP